MRTAISALLALAASCGALQQPSGRGVDGPSKALALLVGIDEYAQPSRGRVPPLSGAENDVRRAGEVLVDRYGFAEDDVLLLTGEAATHEGIIRAFHDHLIKRAVAGTKVVFWYSGHGSRTLDHSGVETSKTKDIGAGAYDNSLLAYDSRARELDGSYDIADDELHSLVRALTEITDQVLIVTDCCHSSGAVRGAADAKLGVRAASHGNLAVSRSALAPFWPPEIRYFDDDEAIELEAFPYVHIAACADYQEAGEIEIGWETFGTLSWFLVEALDEVLIGDSWRTVIERVRARVAGCGNRPDQTVIGAGMIDRAVFENDIAPPLPGFRVDRTDHGLRIEAGRVHGLTDDATFEILALRDGSRRGLARATLMSASWCLAKWSEGGDPELADDALRAVPDASALGMSPFRVLIDEELDAAMLEDVPWAVASDEKTANYRLRKTDQGAVLCDLQGRRVRPVPLDPAAMHATLFREYTFRGLWESVMQPSAWQVELVVEAADAKARALGKEHGIPLATLQPVVEGSNAARVTAEPMSPTEGGSLLTLRATNRSDRDLRMTVLSLSENREVNIVWPPRSEWDRVLRAGESQPVTVVVGPSTDWGETRPMVDRYIAIATLEPADFTAFTSSAPVWAPVRGGPPPVPSFLRNLLVTEPTRGGAETFDIEFGLAWCDLHLSSPDAGDTKPVNR